MDYKDIQDCYYCGKSLYAVDDESYVVCSKCWITFGDKPITSISTQA